ncbi:MAG TPA: methyl-accepting chemotaxis protein, partial [Candidatus Pacearchaeota archaeon]|nr:methyl-accepting chemotaxis protein [Candidatus Pacearchaeota archaeon]
MFSLFTSNNGLETYKRLSDQTSTISEIELNFFNASLALKDYIINYNDEIKDLFFESFKKIKTSLLDIEINQTISPQKFQENLDKYQNYFNKIVELNEEKETLINQNFNNKINSLKEGMLGFQSKFSEEGFYTFSSYVDNINEVIGKITSYVQVYFSSQSVGDKNNILEMFDQLNSQLSLIQYVLPTDESIEIILQIQDLSNEVFDIFNQMVEAIESQEPIIQEMEQLRVE